MEVVCAVGHMAEMLTEGGGIQNPSPYLGGSGCNSNRVMTRESASKLVSHQETLGVKQRSGSSSPEQT